MTIWVSLDYAFELAGKVEAEAPQFPPVCPDDVEVLLSLVRNQHFGLVFQFDRLGADQVLRKKDQLLLIGHHEPARCEDKRFDQLDPEGWLLLVLENGLGNHVVRDEAVLYQVVQPQAVLRGGQQLAGHLVQAERDNRILDQTELAGMLYRAQWSPFRKVTPCIHSIVVTQVHNFAQISSCLGLAEAGGHTRNTPRSHSGDS